MSRYIASFHATVHKEDRKFDVLFANEDFVIYDCAFKRDNGSPGTNKNISTSRKLFSKRTGWNP